MSDAQESAQPHSIASSEALKRVLEVARRLGASDDVQEILTVIIDALRDLLSAERATVFRYDSRTDELVSTVAHGLADAGREFRIPSGQGLAGESARTRQTLNIADCYQDSRFSRAVDQQTGYHTRNLLCLPLVGSNGDLVGIAQVLNRREGAFTDQDERIGQALAMQAAVALQRAILMAAKLRQEKLDRDLALARMMQESTWPNEVPQPRGYEIVTFVRPAEETGGDTFDVCQLDPAHFLVLMADAAGHGIGPALSVLQVRAMMRMAMRCGARIEHAITYVNEQLQLDLPPGRFVTAFFGRLDAADHALTYFSSGQGPILHYQHEARESKCYPADSVPLGILPMSPHETASRISLAPGDHVLLLSDGFYEATDEAGRMFGHHAIEQIVHREGFRGARAVMDAILMELQHHAGSHPLTDDCTAIIIHRRLHERGSAGRSS